MLLASAVVPVPSRAHSTIPLAQIVPPIFGRVPGLLLVMLVESVRVVILDLQIAFAMLVITAPELLAFNALVVLTNRRQAILAAHSALQIFILPPLVPLRTAVVLLVERTWLPLLDLPHVLALLDITPSAELA